MYTKLTINGWTRGGLYARREKGLKDRRHKAGGSSTWIAGSSRCAGDSVNPRPGVTLTEVLVAIFIMGIGLLSLLVLFPLGALNMAQAIKDNRATQSCTNAYAAFQMLKTTSGTLLLRDDPTNVFPYFTASPDTSSLATPRPYLVSPSGGSVPAGALPPNAATNIASGYNLQSYPVFVDPVGVFITTGGTGSTLGVRIGQYTEPTNPTLNSPGFFRVAPATTTTALTSRLMIDRWCTNLDDIQFYESGAPTYFPPGGPPSSFQRNPRYSWAWFLRQTVANSTPPPPVDINGINLSIVVYDRRSWRQQGSGLPPIGESSYKAQFKKERDTVQILWLPSSQPTPPIKPGTWILDASLNVFLVVRGESKEVKGVPNGYFYRVVSTSSGPPVQIGSLTFSSMTVQLHTPAKADSGDPLNAFSGYAGVAVVMEGVVEVYEMGPTF